MLKLLVGILKALMMLQVSLKRLGSSRKYFEIHKRRSEGIKETANMFQQF